LKRRCFAIELEPGEETRYDRVHRDLLPEGVTEEPRERAGQVGRS